MACKKRTRTWEPCISALLSTPTLEAAASRAGVGLRTLKDYLRDAEFLSLYREARRALVEGAVARLQRVTLQAVRTWHRNLTCGNFAVEVRAATEVLDAALRGVGPISPAPGSRP
jgi:hypothetical protein